MPRSRSCIPSIACLIPKQLYHEAISTAGNVWVFNTYVTKWHFSLNENSIWCDRGTYLLTAFILFIPFACGFLVTVYHWALLAAPWLTKHGLLFFYCVCGILPCSRKLLHLLKICCMLVLDSDCLGCLFLWRSSRAMVHTMSSLLLFVLLQLSILLRFLWELKRC